MAGLKNKKSPQRDADFKKKSTSLYGLIPFLTSPRLPGEDFSQPIFGRVYLVNI